MPAKQHRILHLFVTLPMGGAENLLLSILRRLNPERFASTVCCIGERGLLGDKVLEMGVPLVELHMLHKGGVDKQIVPTLVDILRRERIDLVHSHLYHANFYGRLAAKKAGIPVIASIHNTYNRPKWHRRLVNWYLSHHTAAIIAGSEEIRHDIVRYDHVPESLVEIIPNSVDLSLSESALSKEEARSNLGLPENTLVLGTVGRLEEQKGHRYLIEALSLLIRDGLNAYLLLVGDGRERIALENLTTKLGLQDRVLFLGTRNDLGNLFRAMDLFIMPSLWEGLSLAMLSAMATSLPVIATSVGGVRQVLGNDEFGFTISPGDPQALAAKIKECQGDWQNTLHRGIQGMQHVRDHYSDDAMVKRLEVVYSRVLGNP